MHILIYYNFMVQQHCERFGLGQSTNRCNVVMLDDEVYHTAMV